MKILYTAAKYDYMDTKRGYSAEHYNCYETLSSISGFQVLYFPYERIQEVGKDQMNQELRDLVDKEKPDILFAMMFTDELKKEVIGDISKNTPCKTIGWFADDGWRFENYSKYWAPYFNWVITLDSEAFKKYHKLGYKNVLKSKPAYNHLMYKSLHLPKVYDVSFVGAAHGNRKEMIQKLEKLGVRVQCWGGGWEAGRVSQEDMIKIFSQSKINLNFTQSAGVLWKELASIFLHRGHERTLKLMHPSRWIDNIKCLPPVLRSKQMKARIFEVSGCGGFCLTEYIEGLEDYYEIDKEIVCFSTLKEAAEKAQYYLEHDQEREKIARAGYERSIQEHTWEKRFHEIFEAVDSKK